MDTKRAMLLMQITFTMKARVDYIQEMLVILQLVSFLVTVPRIT
jgi:hypothetical protein